LNAKRLRMNRREGLLIFLLLNTYGIYHLSTRRRVQGQIQEDSEEALFERSDVGDGRGVFFLNLNSAVRYFTPPSRQGLTSSNPGSPSARLTCSGVQSAAACPGPCPQKIPRAFGLKVSFEMSSIHDATHVSSLARPCG